MVEGYYTGIRLYSVLAVPVGVEAAFVLDGSGHFGYNMLIKGAGR